MRILVAVPTFENIYPDTFKSIYDLDKGEHEVDFNYIRGYDCATARNNIAQYALSQGYDYVLMVDNDITLPPYALSCLLEEEKDVVLGYYAHRFTNNIYNGKVCVGKLYQPDGEPYFNYPIEGNYFAVELHEMAENGTNKVRIHGGGMGCALIKTDVFNKIEYPWYDWVNYSDAERGLLSEDLFFCERCKNKGIEIYCDTRVGCGHMLRLNQWPE